MNETLTIAAFVLGATQIVKDLGWVNGQYLKLLAVAFGALATYLSLYMPELYASLSAMLVATGVTGTVSFINEQRQ